MQNFTSTKNGPSNPPHIVVVEDDSYVREVLDTYLRDEGYRVTVTSDGKEMRAALESEPAQLVLMDLRLPGEDGFTLTRVLREKYKLGIIILTTRNDTVDRVVGLECGADDYITKPFEERELLARIRSVLRRSGEISAADSQQEFMEGRESNGEDRRISFHGFTLDEYESTLKLPDGETTELTGNECRLLSFLARNIGVTQNRETLMARVLKREWDPMDRSIDVLITRLRHKIETSSKKPEIIKTVRGKGYVLAGDPETVTSSNAA